MPCEPSTQLNYVFNRLPRAEPTADQQPPPQQVPAPAAPQQPQHQEQQPAAPQPVTPPQPSAWGAPPAQAAAATGAPRSLADIQREQAMEAARRAAAEEQQQAAASGLPRAPFSPPSLNAWVKPDEGRLSVNSQPQVVEALQPQPAQQQPAEPSRPISGLPPALQQIFATANKQQPAGQTPAAGQQQAAALAEADKAASDTGEPLRLPLAATRRGEVRYRAGFLPVTLASCITCQQLELLRATGRVATAIRQCSLLCAAGRSRSPHNLLAARFGCTE